jgi:hypothetical protein
MSDDEAYIEMDGKRHYLSEILARRKKVQEITGGYGGMLKKNSPIAEKFQTVANLGEAPETKFMRRRRAEILARKRKTK